MFFYIIEFYSLFMRKFIVQFLGLQHHWFIEEFRNTFQSRINVTCSRIWLHLEECNSFFVLKAGNCFLTCLKKHTMHRYLRRNSTGMILFFILISVKRAYFFLLKHTFIPQFSCFSKVILRFFLIPTSRRDKYWLWLNTSAFNTCFHTSALLL